MQLVNFNNAPATMSSREIAELTEKRHSDVCRDIRNMLKQIHGEKDDADLRHQEIQGVTEERDERGYVSFYCLDRNHTFTLVAGYRADLRFRIIQRWQELESHKSGSEQLKFPNLESAMSIAREGAKLARAFGFKGNMIALSGNTLAKTVTGVDMLALMGATHLIADPRGMTYTPTELGAMCDPKLSAIKFNLLLEAAGLQTKEFGSWLPTDAADGKFEWLDTNKRHTDGTPVKQIKWFSSVLNDVAAPKIRATA